MSSSLSSFVKGLKDFASKMVPDHTQCLKMTTVYETLSYNSTADFLLLYGKLNTSAKPSFLILLHKLGQKSKFSKKHFKIEKKSKHRFSKML